MQRYSPKYSPILIPVLTICRGAGIAPRALAHSCGSGRDRSKFNKPFSDARSRFFRTVLRDTPNNLRWLRLGRLLRISFGKLSTIRHSSLIPQLNLGFESLVTGLFLPNPFSTGMNSTALLRTFCGGTPKVPNLGPDPRRQLGSDEINVRSAVFLGRTDCD